MKEENLIFLISQPRSGSTLMQKILGAHSKVYTRSEPWLMLSPSYTLKDYGIYSEYNIETERDAFKCFIKDLPEGRDTYIKELRGMYLNLYSYYLDNTDYEFYLDKTPRYYFIVDELLQIFPKAKFIVLIRNPLAVLGSIITSWTKRNWFNLSGFKYDLTRAIEVNINAIENAKENFLIIRYEELLSESDKTLKDIFLHLGVDFEKDVLDYHANNENWAFGDPVSVYSKKGIDKSNDKKWTKGLVDPQYWRVIHDYLHYLGPDKFNALGYDFDENLMLLKNNMPAKTLRELNAKTFPMFSFLDDTRECLIDKKRAVFEKHAVFERLKRHIEKLRSIRFLRNPIAKLQSYRHLIQYYQSIK